MMRTTYPKNHSSWPFRWRREEWQIGPLLHEVTDSACGVQHLSISGKVNADVICETQYLAPLPSRNGTNNFMLINKILSTIYAVQSPLEYWYLLKYYLTSLASVFFSEKVPLTLLPAHISSLVTVTFKVFSLPWNNSADLTSLYTIPGSIDWQI